MIQTIYASYLLITIAIWVVHTLSRGEVAA